MPAISGFREGNWVKNCHVSLENPSLIMLASSISSMATAKLKEKSANIKKTAVGLSVFMVIGI